MAINNGSSNWTRIWSFTLYLSRLRFFSPIFHSTDRTREAKKLFIIWLQYFSICGGFLHLNTFDRLLLYYNKFNRQRFDIYICYLPDGRSVLEKYFVEVSKTAEGRRSYVVPSLRPKTVCCALKKSLENDFRSACLRTEIFLRELTLSSTLNPNPKSSHSVDPQFSHKLLFYLY